MKRRDFCGNLASVALASACAPRASRSGGDALTIWETYNAEEHEVFVELAREFEGGRGGLRLDVQRVPYEGLLPKLKYAAITNTAPDVCRVDNAWVLTLAYGKAVVPLDTLPGFGAPLDVVASEYVPAAVATNVVEVPDADGVWRKHLFGLTDQTNCVALFWNRANFRDSAAALGAALLL